MKKVSIVLLSSLLFLSFILAGCDLLTPRPELSAAANVTATTGGKSITLSWDAVANATGYKVYYTSDGTAPTTASSSLTPTGTSVSHDSLDDTLTYKYVVQANADGYKSSLSEAVSARPDNVIEMNIAASAYPSQQFVITIFSANVGDDFATTKTVSGRYTVTTNAGGDATKNITIDRVHAWGYTISADLDESGTISTGDMVWGSGGAGTFTYLFWSTARTTSFTLSYDPWDDYVSPTDSVADASHIY